MGSQTKYKDKELVFVTLVEIGAGGTAGTETLKYVFSTNIPTSDRTELGHTPVTDIMARSVVQGLVMGCSYPKPSRATKRTPLRVTSSFYSHTKGKTELRKLGYKVRRFNKVARIVNSPSALVKTVLVTISGLRYAWNIPKVTETNLPSGVTLAQLGVIDPPVGSSFADVVYGATVPKPGKVSATTITGDDVKTISTYYDPDLATIPAAFTPVKAARLTLR